MINSRPYCSPSFTKVIKTPLVILVIGCTLLLGACNNAQEITDESTLGSNNAAQTNEDKMERNSIDDVAEAKAEQRDDQVVIVEAEK